jgi:hypothetical protein
MKCNVDDCQNETEYRCGMCGEPVCLEHSVHLEHAEVWFAVGVLALPMMELTEGERLCNQCAYKLQEEREQASRKLHSVV